MSVNAKSRIFSVIICELELAIPTDENLLQHIQL